jgi:NADH-quinone oxidoreductase subunit F
MVELSERRVIIRDDAPDPYAAWQRCRSIDPDRLIAEIELSGVRGRGGAGFPAARKMRLTRAEDAPRKYVVVNGAEDEPGSQKDQYLLEGYPALVVEGALLAAHAIGAAHIVFYLSEAHPESAKAIKQTLREANAHVRLIGASADGEGSSDSLTASVVLSPRTYVAGEDTAALELIEGHQGLPRQKPPYPASRGLHGAPTLVSNVETLATFPRILTYGAEWYRSLGTADSPGTMLFTLGEEMVAPGIYELELGTPLRVLIEDCGGGLRSHRSLRAVLPGGPSSGFLTKDEIDVPLEHSALKARGSALGCGVVHVYDDSECMVEVLEGIAKFFAAECCGQCPPCRMETGLLQRLIGQTRAGTGNAALLDKLPEVLDFAADKGGFCSLITMPGPPVRSAIQRFRSDFEHHIQFGGCPAIAA